MSQPVKLSDSLVLDARIAAQAQERSIAGQVEFWAKLGQSAAKLLDGKQVLKLQQMGEARPLSELLATVETEEGRARTRVYLASRPYPHYRQFPGQRRTYIRTDADGTETVGRFVNRSFVVIHMERETAPLSKGEAAARSEAKPAAGTLEPTA
jgi:hypothetical protein